LRNIACSNYHIIFFHMKVAVVGATGLVGSIMAKVLEERKFPVSEFLPVASPKSEGNDILFKGRLYKVLSAEECCERKPDIALFSAGSRVSMEWAPKFARVGSIVIDNSSAWRMHEKVPLVVPEINAHIIKARDRIISNPNCATIQLLMAIAPLHRRYKITRMVVSTYQSVTGTGVKAVQQLMNERAGIQGETAYPHQIDLNVIPHAGTFLHSGYTTEEMKLVDETKKILNDYSVQITATVVRVPVFGGHSESVNIEFAKEYDFEDVRLMLSELPGVVYKDDILNAVYPMPLYSEGKDDVFVGRLRRDDTRPSALNMWVVADNLRKGAATNAVQIAEYVIREFKTAMKAESV
jgi:aspartate-semialdehyde dehydrogenase